MKKIYMSPVMDIIELKKQTLLAGSAPVLGGDFEGTGSDVLAPDLDSDLIVSSGDVLDIEL